MFRYRSVRRVFYGLLSLIMVGGLILSSYTPATAAITQATITEILDGNEVFINNQRVSVNAIAHAQQQIRTGASRVEFRFNTGAIGRLSQNSQIIVGEECFNIQQGTILINGKANGCTRSQRLSVRGTTYTVEMKDNGDTQITVLEGEVAVAPATSDPATSEPTSEPTPHPTPNPQTPTSDKSFFKLPKLPPIPIFGSDSDPTVTDQQPVVIASGEKFSISQSGEQSRVEKLSQLEFKNILNGHLFRGFRSQLPGIQKIRKVFQDLFPGIPFPLPSP